MARVAVTMTRDLIVDGVLYKAGETVELPGVSAAVVIDRGAGVPVCASEEIAAPAEGVGESIAAVLVVEEPEPEEKPAPRRRSRKAKDEDAQPEEPEGGESEAEDASEPATGEGQEI